MPEEKKTTFNRAEVNEMIAAIRTHHIHVSQLLVAWSKAKFAVPLQPAQMIECTTIHYQADTPQQKPAITIHPGVPQDRMKILTLLLQADLARVGEMLEFFEQQMVIKSEQTTP